MIGVNVTGVKGIGVKGVGIRTCFLKGLLMDISDTYIYI